MQPVYQKDTEEASRALAALFEAHPEAMTPLLNIVVEAKVTLDAFIDVVGRSCLEAVLQLSAAEIAGPPHQGKAGGDVFWHGSQAGVVTLPTQKVRVTKPRLRRRGGGKGAEVAIPAYTAMQQGPGLREKLAAILLRGVNTRAYADVIPAMADDLRVSSRVRWVGQLTSAEMSWCLYHCAAFVMTSRVEACPNTALEAMSHGALCVSNRNPPMPEFFQDSALYYAAGDAHSLAVTLEDALSLSLAAQAELRARAQTRALAFHWSETASRTLDELERACQTSVA